MSRASHRTAVVHTIGDFSLDTGRVATRGGALATSVAYVFRVVEVTGAAEVDARCTGRFSSLPWACATPEHTGAVMLSARSVAAHGEQHYTKPQHHTRWCTYPWRRYAQD